MNANELLDVIGGARDRYVAAAMETRNGIKESRPGMGKLMFIAAILAMTMVLAGCVAVFMGLRDKQIAEDSRTKRFNEYGLMVEPTEVKEAVVSLYGSHSDPIHLAAKEWYEYRQTLPDDIWTENPDNELGLPLNHYDTYGCYTQEMSDKVTEIAEKYGLKLLDQGLLAQRWQNDVMLDTLGIDGVCQPGVDAENGAGLFYPNGSFWLNVDFPADETFPHLLSCKYSYAKTDFFDPAYQSIDVECQQWEYTAKDGTPLLLVMGKEFGYIFANRGDAAITIMIHAFYEDMFPEGEQDFFTKELLEQVADKFSYQLKPKSFDLEAVKPKLAEAEAAHEASLPQWEEPIYHSYGEYLNDQLWLNTLFYHLRDLTGDGQEELLVGRGDGSFDHVLTIAQDGTVQEIYGNIGSRLCENGCIQSFADSGDGRYMEYIFSDLAGGTETVVDHIQYSDGSWAEATAQNPYFANQPISMEAAKEILDKYVVTDLEFQSVLFYPMEENGKTLGQVVRENDPILSQQDMIQKYAEFVPTHRSIFPLKYYAIRDINGDGVIDLLLSDDTETICELFTIDRGRIDWIPESRVYLCEDNVLKRVWDHFDSELGRYEGYTFRKMDGRKQIPLGQVLHILSTDTWKQGDIHDHGPEISEEEANAFLSQYSVIDPGMKPLNQLGDR